MSITLTAAAPMVINIHDELGIILNMRWAVSSAILMTLYCKIAWRQRALADNIACAYDNVAAIALRAGMIMRVIAKTLFHQGDIMRFDTKMAA